MQKRDYTFLISDSIASEKMHAALTNKRLMNGIKQASPFGQTSCLEGFHSVSVTRFFQQSLPKFCSNFTKLRKILPNVGLPNNYVIIMPKNNSYVMKVEKIFTKRYLEILVVFIPLQFLLMIRIYFLGLAVLFITLSTLLHKKHTFLPK